MSFRSPPLGTIKKGAGARPWYRISGGADVGALYAMADPQNPDAVLAVDYQTKRRESDGTITYLVSVRNIGPVDTEYRLIGGGLT